MGKSRRCASSRSRRLQINTGSLAEKINKANVDSLENTLSNTISQTNSEGNIFEKVYLIDLIYYYLFQIY